MKTHSIYYIILTSLIIALLYFIFTPYRIVPFEYNLTLGQISDRDIIAPFDFDIYKDEESYLAEQEMVSLNVQPIYKISETLTFNALKNLDFIIKPFIIDKQTNFIEIKNKLLRNGFFLSDTTLIYLMNEDFRNTVYGFLSDELVEKFHIGIYPENFPYHNIKIKKDKEIIDYSLSRLFSLTEAKEKIIAKLDGKLKQGIIEELLNIILIVNIIKDTDATRIAQQMAKDKVSPMKGKVLKNEKIINKNQKVTSDILLKLNSLIKVQKNQQKNISNIEIIQSSAGILFVSFIILFFFHYIFMIYYSNIFPDHKYYLIFCLSLLLLVFLTVITNHTLELSTLIIPYALSIIIITYIFNPEIALIFNTVQMLFISLFLNWTLIDPLILNLSSLGAIIAIIKLKNKQNYFVVTLYLLISMVAVNIAFSLFKFDSLQIFFLRVFYGFISISISIILAMMILPFIQKKLHITSKQILLELLDFENPLLRRMQKQTPGTYHHSHIVGNLAETAAEAIGADFRLARIGGYYHDIGKMENPDFFIENNSNSSDLHDRLMANESATIIKNHIFDGISLAKKEKLPQSIIDIIEQHHGDSQIKYFYNKAIETNLHIEKDIYYYNGPKPQTKEAVIVMIADIVESTTKSLNSFSEEIFKKLLDDTILRLINENQLSEAPITVKELEVVKKFMFPILLGIYRKRIEYPNN